MATVAENKKETKWLSYLKNAGIVVLGVIVGKIAGSAVGRPSGALGIGTTGLGFVLLDKMDDKKWLGYFTIGAGAGMIASPVVEVAPSSVKGLSGLAAVGEDAKEGSKDAISNLARKFYLDKTPLAKYIPGVSGLGDTDQLTDEDAQRVIDEMIKDQEAAKENQATNGFGEVEGMDGSLNNDYGVNGTSLTDDYMNGTDDEEMDGVDEDDEMDGVDDEEMGDFGKPSRILSFYNKAVQRFGKNHPKVKAYANRHPMLLKASAMGELEEILSGSIGEEYVF